MMNSTRVKLRERIIVSDEMYITSWDLRSINIEKDLLLHIENGYCDLYRYIRLIPVYSNPSSRNYDPLLYMEGCQCAEALMN